MSPTKYILVGDPHVKKDNLEESRRLFLWIAGLAKEHDATPILMGDQHDGHGNVRVEVLEFWHWAYKLLGNSISLTGNHDMNMECTASALVPNEAITRIIHPDRQLHPVDQSMGLYAVSFCRKTEDFEAALRSAPLDCKTILCHQEFNGAQYENGFYAPGGANVDVIPAGMVCISGHIHKQQIIPGRVVYVGTPRHLSASEAGQAKGVVLWDGERFTNLYTPAEVCEPIIKITVDENTPKEAYAALANSGKVFVEIQGSEEFVKDVAKQLPEQVKVRLVLNKSSESIEIKESEGIGQAFKKYFDQYAEQNRLPEAQKAEIANIVLELCPGLK